jgi:outer membrane receptor protein involved in Fe transport
MPTIGSLTTLWRTAPPWMATVSPACRNISGASDYAHPCRQTSSSIVADDTNRLWVDSWGAGITNLRLGWNGEAGQMQIAPFLGLNNLWDRRYVASVTLNGLGSRVFEPAPRRVIYVGTEIGYAAAP